MLDLSNNNHGGINWRAVHATGTQRVYLKLTEGDTFVDKTHAARRKGAHAAFLKVGEYHFARPSRNSPRGEADFFLEHLPHPLHAGQDLRPCLDLEDPDVHPGVKIGRWADEWVRYVQRHIKHTVVLYGSAYYLQACRYPNGSTPLWLASYGRNDGKEHPFKVPPPWKHAAALQFTSRGRHPGVPGLVDVSRVLETTEIDIAVTR